MLDNTNKLIFLLNEYEKGNTSTLVALADFFKITLDSSRLKDYVILEFDYTIPKIKIYDETSSIVLSGEYTGDAKILNSSSSEPKYLRVVEKNLKSNLEKLYEIGDDEPLVENLTYSKDDFELVIEKEFPHNIFLGNSGIRCKVQYQRLKNQFGQRYSTPLLTRIAKTGEIFGNENGYFEQIYTYGQGYFEECDVCINKYSYIIDDNIIYAIANIDSEDVCQNFKGVCFEKFAGCLKEYLPPGIDLRKYPELLTRDANSAFIFNGKTIDNQKHSLLIYKNCDGITIKYEQFNRLTKNNECSIYNISNLISGKINGEEIRLIIKELKTLASNNFLGVVCQELETLAMKLDIKNGVLVEVLDALDPKLLMFDSLESLAQVIEPNIDAYFDLAHLKFQEAKTIMGDGSLIVRDLKPKNNE